MCFNFLRGHMNLAASSGTEHLPTCTDVVVVVLELNDFMYDLYLI